MLGPAAGLSALLLFAFDPGMLAHGALVTTDTGCAALSTLCLFALWRYLRARTRERACSRAAWRSAPPSPRSSPRCSSCRS